MPPVYDWWLFTAYSSSTSETQREYFLDYGDLLIRIANIWGASNSNQRNILEKICKKEKSSNSWEIQASITTSPNCPADYLHNIAIGLGKEPGYGYILRIISRNQNVKKETLEAIANDPNLELRYTQCAMVALEYGNDVANHQI